MPRKPINNAERFWSNVDIRDVDDCWQWKRSTSGANGYGLTCFQGKQASAHRMSYYYSFGEIPDGMCVLHKCDNRICVNPSHLFLGTNKDNTRDMMIKGRNSDRHGENHHLNKLDNNDVVSIREMYRDGFSQSEIARRFGIGQPAVSRIVNNQRWNHLGG